MGFMDPVSGSACLLALVGLLAAIIFLQLLALLLLRCTSCLRGETTPRYSWTASRGHGNAQPVAAVVPYKRSLAEIRADRPKALPDQQEQGRHGHAELAAISETGDAYCCRCRDDRGWLP